MTKFHVFFFSPVINYKDSEVCKTFGWFCLDIFLNCTQTKSSVSQWEESTQPLLTAWLSESEERSGLFFLGVANIQKAFVFLLCCNTGHSSHYPRYKDREPTLTQSFWIQLQRKAIPLWTLWAYAVKAEEATVQTRLPQEGSESLTTQRKEAKLGKDFDTYIITLSPPPKKKRERKRKPSSVMDQVQWG